MFHTLLRPLITITLIAASSCGDRVPTGTTEHQIMPLKIGNWWIYKVYTITIAGLSTRFDTIRIVSESTPPADVPGAGNSFVDQRGRTYYYVGNELHVIEQKCDADPTLNRLCGARAMHPTRVGETFGMQKLPGHVTKCSESTHA